MSDPSPFARNLVYLCTVFVFLLVCGVLFGPWEIDPNASVLIAIVGQPGGVALGWVLQSRSHKEATS